MQPVMTRRSTPSLVSPRRLRPLAGACAMALALAGPAVALQDDDEGPTSIPTLELAELDIVHYVPKYRDARSLRHVVQDFVGRSFYLRERGGASGKRIANVTQLGDALVLYDTPDYLTKLMDAIRALDVGDLEPPEDEWATETYQLRYIDASAAAQALHDGSDAVRVVPERGLVVIESERRHVETLLRILREVDVPESQVLIQVQLLHARSGKESGSDIDPELSRGLAELLPGFGFQSIGVAVLQSTVAPGRRVQLNLVALDGGEYSLSLRPIAYDPKTGDLTVQECEAKVGRADPESGVFETSQMFSTATVLRGGEFSVIGATGETPTFVVIKIRPVR